MFSLDFVNLNCFSSGHFEVNMNMVHLFIGTMIKQKSREINRNLQDNGTELNPKIRSFLKQANGNWRSVCENVVDLMTSPAPYLQTCQPNNLWQQYNFRAINTRYGFHSHTHFRTYQFTAVNKAKKNQQIFLWSLFVFVSNYLHRFSGFRSFNLSLSFVISCVFLAILEILSFCSLANISPINT